MRKIKHYYRIDNKNRPIPGSNVSRPKKPNFGRYKEITLLCCDPNDIPCTCSFRYWVRLDANNEPVPGSLIKRNLKPENGNYQEISWLDACCILDIAPFVAELNGPTGTILDESGEGIYAGELYVNITDSQDYQLGAITHVDYYVDNVLVGSVEGQGTTSSEYLLEYDFDLPSNQSKTFSYYAIIHFDGGVTLQTATNSFTLQYNAGPVFNGSFNAYGAMVMSEDTQAQIAGWAADSNGAAALEITFDGLPDFATEEVFDYASVKVFRISLTPTTGDAGSYPITVTADDGVNPPISKVITLTVDNTDEGTYAPMIYPYTQDEPLELVYGNNPGFLSYDKIGFSSTPQSSVSSANTTPNMMNSFGGGNGATNVTIIPGFAANRTGEGLMAITYANGGIVQDFFLLRVLITPA